MRVGIVGFGAWGSIHAESVSRLSNHELVGIACYSEATAESARTTYPDIQVFTDYQKLLSVRDLDVVHVVVPSYLHTEVALAAIASGKHVLLEKPMATTLEDCNRIVQAAEDTGRNRGSCLSVVHELRCSEQWGSVKSAIDDGEIGLPSYAMLNLFRFPYRQGAGKWRYDRSKVGSWVLEEPIHFFDLLLWYMESSGKPVSVTAFTNEYSEGLARDFTSIVQFESGGYGVVSQTLSGFEHHQVVEVTGSKGAVRSTWSGALDRTDKPEFQVTIQGVSRKTAEPLEILSKSGELFEIQKYIELAYDGFAEGRSVYPARQEMELIHLCLAAEQAARYGKPVNLMEF